MPSRDRRGRDRADSCALHRPPVPSCTRTIKRYTGVIPTPFVHTTLAQVDPPSHISKHIAAFIIWGYVPCYQQHTRIGYSKANTKPLDCASSEPHFYSPIYAPRSFFNSFVQHSHSICRCSALADGEGDDGRRPLLYPLFPHMFSPCAVPLCNKSKRRSASGGEGWVLGKGRYERSFIGYKRWQRPNTI